MEEESAASNYIHQGMADQEYREMCFNEEGRMKKICQENSQAFSGAMGTLEAMMPIVTKAYSLFTVIGGSKITARNLNEDGEQMFDVERGGETETIPQSQVTQSEIDDGVATEAEGTEKTDYCGYIGMLGEAVNLAMTASRNQQTQQNYQSSKPEARQAAAFYSLAENEKTNKDASNLQFYVWGGSAACYAVYVSQAQFRGDWKVYAKLAGSTAIAAFYKAKAAAHAKRAKLLTEMAKDLPQPGDCNPYTMTTCFCNEPSSVASDPTNYKKFCVPEGLNLRVGSNGTPVPCVDQNGKVDMQCKCQQNKTCVDRRIRMSGVDIGLDPIAMRDPLAGISPLSSGVAGANLGNIADSNLALAENALNNNAPDSLNNLNPDQKKEAKNISKLLGVTPAAGPALAATRSTGGSLPKSATAGLGGEIAPAALARNGSSRRASRASRGKRRFQSAGEAKSNNRGMTPIGRRKNSRRGSSNNIDIEKYASKATEAAEIRGDKGTSIFEVISHRYRSSAWREFPAAFRAQNSQP
ncbi:MAG: hypothetical protein CME65_04010 [Halobacteriovoraceae bacterium]|nr:hypothetical protein [Halobacteriovoraceae bacterium]